MGKGSLGGFWNCVFFIKGFKKGEGMENQLTER